MNQIAIAAINPILVLFSTLGVPARRGLRTRKLRVILVILFFMPLMGTTRADETAVPEQYRNEGESEWHSGEAPSSSSSESSSSGSSYSGDSHSGSSAQTQRATALNDQGNALANKGLNLGHNKEYESAIRYFQQAARLFQEALRIQPTDRVLQGNLQTTLRNLANMQGAAAQDKNDYQSAIHYYQEAVRIEPSDLTLRGNLACAQGHLACNKGDYKSAIHYYQEALRSNPTSRVSQGNLAVAQAAAASAKGDWNSAIHYFQEAVRLNPTERRYPALLANAQAAAAAKSNKVETASAGAAAASATGDHSTASSNKKSSDKPTLPLEAFSQSERQTTGPVSKREAKGTNRRAGDQLMSAKAVGPNAGKVFDEGTGQNAGPLQSVKVNGSIEIDRAPAIAERFKKDPEIKKFEAQRVAAQTDRKKAEAELKSVTAALAKPGANKGEFQVKQFHASEDVTKAASRENAARINEEDTARKLSFKETKLSDATTNR